MVGVGKTLPTGKKILDNIYLSFYYGAKIGVLGLNGSGKSTLLKIIAGIDKNHDGTIQAQPGLTIGMLEQEPDLGDPTRTVREVVEEGMQSTVDLLKAYEAVNEKYAGPRRRLRRHHGRAVQAPGGDRPPRRVGPRRAPPAGHGRAPLPARRQPHRPALGRREAPRRARAPAALQTPDVLLLDEPTNHLDAESVEWLEHYLAGFPGTVIAVTHDRYFLDNVAGWILELDRGKGIPFEGNYTRWLEQKEARLRTEEKQASSRQKTLAQELEWVRQNAKGRRTKSKARLAAYDELQAGASEARIAELEIYIPPGPRLGNVVVEAEHVEKGYDGKHARLGHARSRSRPAASSA